MYAKITNGSVDQYPYTVGKLRRDNPNTSFPKRISDEMLAEWGVYSVTALEIPSYDNRTQRIEQNAQPHQESGEWLIGWTTVDKTSKEIAEYDNNAAASVRSQRNHLLSETDWIVIMHTEKGTNIPVELEVYRQALRDITTHENFPYLQEEDWPTEPV